MQRSRGAAHEKYPSSRWRRYTAGNGFRESRGRKARGADRRGRSISARGREENQGGDGEVRREGEGQVLLDAPVGGSAGEASRAGAEPRAGGEVDGVRAALDIAHRGAG